MGVYTDLLMPAANFLRDVEMVGLIYDVDAAADMYENEVRPELDQLKKDMRDISDIFILNPASPTQMAHLYYDVWGIDHEMRHRPPTAKRDFLRSTDDSARRVILEGDYTSKADRQTVEGSKEGYRDRIEAFVRKHERYAKLSKINSTYIVGMLPHALESADHRIFTNLNLHTTETGRLSSTEPNLQNISRPRTGLPDIRQLFHAPNGRQIVQADFSQAELRVIAHLSQDNQLLRIYRDGLDLHSEVATMFFGKDFTSEQRSRCKNMNFGVAYRQSAKSFKEKHDIPKAEAQKFIDWWWGRFSGVTRWEKSIEQLVHAGELNSPFGRKRRFYLITDQNKEALYREGINFYPQSTASDLTLIAGVQIHQRVDRDRARINLLVHDSIMAEVDDGYVDEYEGICKDVMESVAKKSLDWDIPFIADVAHAPTWGGAK